MNKPSHSKLLTLLGMGISGLMLTSPAFAHANDKPTGYNQLSFQTEVSQEVENDEVTASLYTTAQADDAKTLATTLNSRINKALAIAKRYPKVEVSSGAQNTRPRYDDEQKIIGWTGRASISLKSNDFTATSQLIADLQDVLVMENINFGVSDAKQDAIEQTLMTQASKAFQRQANSLAGAWGATDYNVVSVNLNAGNRYYPRPMMAESVMVVDSGSSPRFEAGNSMVTVTANGTIELVK